MSDGGSGGGGPITIFEKITDTAGQAVKSTTQAVGGQAKAFGQTFGGQVFGGAQSAQGVKPTPQGTTQQFPKLDNLGGLGKLPSFEKNLGGKFPLGQKPQQTQIIDTLEYKQQVAAENQQTQAQIRRITQELRGLYHDPILKVGEGLAEKQRQEKEREEQLEEQERQKLQTQQGQMEALPQTGSKATGPGAIVKQRAETKRESKHGSG